MAPGRHARLGQPLSAASGDALRRGTLPPCDAADDGGGRRTDRVPSPFVALLRQAAPLPSRARRNRSLSRAPSRGVERIRGNFSRWTFTTARTGPLPSRPDALPATISFMFRQATVARERVVQGKDMC